MRLYTNRFIEVLNAYDPASVLLVEGNSKITAGQLMRDATYLATALIEKGVQKGDRIVMAVKPGVEFLIVMYANMMLGTVISIIDPEMGKENYRAKLAQFAPHHVFIDSRILFLEEHPLLKWLALRFRKHLPSFPRQKNFSLFTTGPALPIWRKHFRLSSLKGIRSTKYQFDSIDEHADLLVTYTSGTLSAPKGVVHSVASLGRSIELLTNLLKQNRDQAIATHLPHYALLGINAGVKVYLWDNYAGPANKIRFIKERQVTTLFGPPSDFIPLIDYLHQCSGSLPACLRNIYLGSAPVFQSFLAKLVPLAEHIGITCLYGMTENLMVTCQDGKEKLDYAEPGDLVGRPFPGIEIKVEEDGEISLRSDQMFTRYWQMENTGAFHKTGDLGRLDNSGRLVLQGRKKDMIIRRHFNIYPGLYEPTISRIPGVKEAVMLGIYNHEKADEEIVLVIDAEPDTRLESAAIMRLLTTGEYSIDKEALPDSILFMDIPHSGRQNKVDRRTLSERLKKL
jgi:acyl-CoA synthetase (AMP-forming)/AMP-acid ligase II